MIASGMPAFARGASPFAIHLVNHALIEFRGRPEMGGLSFLPIEYQNTPNWFSRVTERYFL